MTLREKYYHKYASLAKHYANKIWDSNNIGMDKEDLIQEFSVILFEAIRMYSIKCKEYKSNGGYAPVPMRNYLRSCLLLKSRDFIKGINKMKLVSMSDINFDYGNDQTISMDADNCEFVIDGFNILDLFHGTERKMIKFKLKGMEQGKIEKIFAKSKLNPKITNEINIERLKNYLIKERVDTREFIVSYQDN